MLIVPSLQMVYQLVTKKNRSRERKLSCFIAAKWQVCYSFDNQLKPYIRIILVSCALGIKNCRQPVWSNVWPINTSFDLDHTYLDQYGLTGLLSWCAGPWDSGPHRDTKLQPNTRFFQTSCMQYVQRSDEKNQDSLWYAIFISNVNVFSNICNVNVISQCSLLVQPTGVSNRKVYITTINWTKSNKSF